MHFSAENKLNAIYKKNDKHNTKKFNDYIRIQYRRVIDQMKFFTFALLLCISNLSMFVPFIIPVLSFIGFRDENTNLAIDFVYSVSVPDKITTINEQRELEALDKTIDQALAIKQELLDIYTADQEAINSAIAKYYSARNNAESAANLTVDVTLTEEGLPNKNNAQKLM